MKYQADTRSISKFVLCFLLAANFIMVKASFSSELNSSLVTSNVNQSNAQQVFDQHFIVVKNTKNEIIAIKSKFSLKSFSLKPYIQELKTALAQETKKIQVQGLNDYEENLNEILLDIDDEVSLVDGTFPNQNVERIKKSILNLPSVDWENDIDLVTEMDFFKTFEDDLKKIILHLDWTVLASPMDQKFFLKKQYITMIVKKALEMAQQRLGNVPLLNIASFLINKVGTLLIEQRYFQQNMLLHLLFNFEKDLNLTNKEINTIFSSIFESRLDTNATMERKQMQANWEGYGVLKIFQAERNAQMFAKVNGVSLLNFAFYNIKDSKTQANLIKHTLVNAHQYSMKKALALDLSKPKRVLKLRLLLNLAQIGIGFIPQIPQNLKDMSSKFIDSLVITQARQEGMLYSHFIMNNQADLARIIHVQTINPFVVIF